MLSVSQQKEFSRENVLKAIAEFMVCDDQVSLTASLFQYLISNLGPVPCSCKQGHILQLHGSNVSSSYQHRLTIHPQFLCLCSQLLHQCFDDLRSTIKVMFSFLLKAEHQKLTVFTTQSSTTGWVSITINLWSIDQTKATFMGITAHWIKEVVSDEWRLGGEVIAFKCITGQHIAYHVDGCGWW